MTANEFNPKRWCMDLILDYEVYDEDGSCVPYFTGRITDAEGRVICQAENEERATELVGYVKALHADYAILESRYNALKEAVAWERECCQDIRPLIGGRGLICMYGEGYVDKIAEDLRARQDAARAEVDRLLGEK